MGGEGRWEGRGRGGAAPGPGGWAGLGRLLRPQRPPLPADALAPARGSRAGLRFTDAPTAAAGTQSEDCVPGSRRPEVGVQAGTRARDTGTQCPRVWGKRGRREARDLVALRGARGFNSLADPVREAGLLDGFWQGAFEFLGEEERRAFWLLYRVLIDLCIILKINLGHPPLLATHSRDDQAKAVKSEDSCGCLSRPWRTEHGAPVPAAGRTRVSS